MTTLWLFGDSFTSTYKEDIPLDPRTWMSTLAKELAVDRVENHSIRGCSQDWMWSKLQACEQKIQPNDYIVIALTHPARVWFHIDHPWISRYEFASEFAKLGLERFETAAKYYCENLQRLDLDCCHVKNRLGWLSYQTVKYGWRRPQLLVAFDQDLGGSWPDLAISKGNLCQISEGEAEHPFNINQYMALLGKFDFRYNHMCLANHQEMHRRLIRALTSDTAVDLTQGWHQNLLTADNLKNPQWAAEQIDTQLLAERNLKASGLKWGANFFTNSS